MNQRSLYEVENELQYRKKGFNEAVAALTQERRSLMELLYKVTDKETVYEIQLKLAAIRKSITRAEEKYLAAREMLMKETADIRDNPDLGAMVVAQDPHRSWVKWGWDGQDLWQLPGKAASWQPARKVHLTRERIRTFYNLVMGGTNDAH